MNLKPYSFSFLLHLLAIVLLKWRGIITKRHSQSLLSISVSYLSEDVLLESSLSVPGAFFMTQLGALLSEMVNFEHIFRGSN